MIFIPIGDENPRARTPYVNYALIGINIVLFILFFLSEHSRTILERYALWPASVTLFNLISSQFLHAGILHIVGNMLILWIFGDNVEDRLGHLGYLAFYLTAGVIGGLVHVWFVPESMAHIPCVGASGAISGVLGAYVLFYPRNFVRIWYIWWFLFFRTGVVYITAKWAIGIWFIVQFLLGVVFRDDDSGIAFMAHIGGFLCGVVMAWVLKSASIPASGLSPDGVGLRPQLEGESKTIPQSTASSVVELSEDSEPFLAETKTSRFRSRIAEPHPDPDSVNVVRATDEIIDTGRIGRIISRHTGESLVDVTMRLRKSRGVIARNVPPEIAEELATSLTAEGLKVLTIPNKEVMSLPELFRAKSAGCSEGGMSFILRDGSRIDANWKHILMVVAARVQSERVVAVFEPEMELVDHIEFRYGVYRRSAGVQKEDKVPLKTDRMTVIDAFLLQPWARIRVTQGETNFNLMNVSGLGAGFKKYAQAVLKFRKGTLVNSGVKVIIHRGQWGYLNFSKERDFDNYCWWLLQLSRQKNR